MRDFSYAALPTGGLLRFAAALLVVALLLPPAGPAGAAITLADMRATAQPDGSIAVRWVTATELNSSQFILYRSEQADGPWENEVNRQDAKDLDGIVGATYDYTDTHVIPNTTYYYVLGELEKSGNLVKYTDARCEATAGQPSTATATATQTRTATPTRTSTPAATPVPAVQPTATRQFTNTPRPTATRTSSLSYAATAGLTPPGPGNATPLPPATISKPGGTPGVGTPIAPAPAASPVDYVAAPTAPATRARATAVPSAVSTVEAAAEATATPQVFGPATSDGALLGTTPRPQSRTTPAPADQPARNTRLILLLGGLAIGLAALLGGTAFAVRRSRRR